MNENLLANPIAPELLTEGTVEPHKPLLLVILHLPLNHPRDPAHLAAS